MRINKLTLVVTMLLICMFSQVHANVISTINIRIPDVDGLNFTSSYINSNLQNEVTISSPNLYGHSYNIRRTSYLKGVRTVAYNNYIIDLDDVNSFFPTATQATFVNAVVIIIQPAIHRYNATLLHALQPLHRLE
jgi:hypothetical protein